MKRLFLLTVAMNGLIALSQKDRFSYNADISFGSVTYRYNEIEVSSYEYSSMDWYDTVHYSKFEHSDVRYYGLNLLFHVGIHLPILKNESFSFGIRPKAGIGRLAHLFPKTGENWSAKVDPKQLNSRSMDIQFQGYFRYNPYSKNRNPSHITLLGGYRFIKSFDNYSTPVITMEFGQEFWSVGLYTHLYRMNYYRIYSNGSRELAKSFHEFGLNVNIFLHKNKKTAK